MSLAWSQSAFTSASLKCSQFLRRSSCRSRSDVPLIADVEATSLECQTDVALCGEDEFIIGNGLIEGSWLVIKTCWDTFKQASNRASTDR